ncbi:hypothetical protein ACD631_19640 [Alteromonas macleodii]|uniref:hypothetical protein n=1 Tax=Alteromonas macleodii TaxID=28108 RepID=UPI0020766CC8|nr:hypothetical protein [Alteromonas macleodii]USI28551.1 hypothetical protein NFG60_02330 [Alteromonas macleodii]
MRKYSFIPIPFLFALILLTANVGAMESNHPQEKHVNPIFVAFLKYESNSNFRGRLLTDSSDYQIGTSVSYYGFSAGIRNQKIESHDSFIAHYLSYSYNFNIANFSVGYQKDDPILESEEIFAEAVFQPYENLEAKVSYYHRLDKKSSNFFEFQLRRPWISDDGHWLAKPYALLSMGNYHGSDFSLNHLEVGSDITYRINSKLFLSAHTLLISPLENVKDVGLNSDSKFNIGISVRYIF